jgi:carbonic anhydrase
MTQQDDDLISRMQKGNLRFIYSHGPLLSKHISGQSPSYAVLTCSDSRVIPEFIFDVGIGEIFVVRVAGNVAFDNSVLSSLEYAVAHLHVSQLIILAHTHCGAVKAAESSNDEENMFLTEIKTGFKRDPNDHVRGNLLHQLDQLPRRSKIINEALQNKSLTLMGAIYHLEDGKVNFL